MNRDDALGQLAEIAGHLAAEAELPAAFTRVSPDGNVYVRAYEYADPATGDPAGRYWVYVTHRMWGPSGDAEDLFLTRADIDALYPRYTEAP